MAKKIRECSFCGRKEDQVRALISGLNGNICNDCIEHTISGRIPLAAPVGQKEKRKDLE